MSLGEIKGFLKAITIKSTEQRLAFISGITVGSQGTATAIKKTINDLEKILKTLDES